MGTMVHSLLWVMQDLYHQQYVPPSREAYLREVGHDIPKLPPGCLEGDFVFQV